MRVFVVVWDNVQSSELNTSNIAVCISKSLADKAIQRHKDEMIDQFSDSDPGAIDLLSDSYRIEEHILEDE